jgi:hypothetical protein
MEIILSLCPIIILIIINSFIMKTYKLFLFLVIMSLIVSGIHAQESITYTGSPDVLKGQTNINIEFVYDGLQVGEFTEEIYLKQKRAEFRKAADGEKFVKKWTSDRSDIYEPKFISEINKDLKKINIVAEKNNQTYKYTMVVQNKKIEPGFFATSGGSKRNTYINLIVQLVETENRSKILFSIKADYIFGLTEEQIDMKETTLKITNSYASAAGKIGKLIVKICSQKEKVKEVPEDMIKHDKKDKKDINSEDDENELDKSIKKDKKDKKSEAEDEEVDKPVKKDNNKEVKTDQSKTKSDKPVKKEKKPKKDPNDDDE